MMSRHNLRKFDIKWSILNQHAEVPEIVAILIAEYTSQSEQQDAEDIITIVTNFRSRVLFYPAYYGDLIEPKWTKFQHQCYDVLRIWKSEEAKIKNHNALHLYKNEETRDFVSYLQGTRETLEWMYDEVAWFNTGSIIEDVKTKIPEL